MISLQLTVQCRGKTRAPCGMARGSATTDGQFAYFATDFNTSVYRYEYSSDKWEELPLCQCVYSGVAIIGGEVTIMGGETMGADFSNKIYTLRQRSWVEKYPPMHLAHSDPAVVCTSEGEYVIVIGGNWTATVELFQVKTKRWYQRTNLPQPLPRTSATICGDLVHVIGDSAKGYSCSLQAILSSIPRLVSWKPLPPLPVTESTVSTLCGELVLIGGKCGKSPVNSIHQLVDGQWVKIGSMASGRSHCLAVSPSPNKIIIVGGWGEGRENRVEECVAV